MYYADKGIIDVSFTIIGLFLLNKIRKLNTHYFMRRLSLAAENSESAG
jgi:hypothetical protein